MKQRIAKTNKNDVLINWVNSSIGVVNWELTLNDSRG